MGGTTDESLVVAQTTPALALAATEAGTTGESLPTGGEAAVPVRLGRYIVLDRLGAGGMGVVYSAFDPELDRKVAIKVLRHVDGLGEEAQRRLLREAQAMARLSHTNVVTVHDVGIVERQLFIAMEFIRGQTLRKWKVGSRVWQDVLAVFMQAGRGLAAAHAAGFVHRDFKPDNVMVGEDGRVVVMDFGLARPEVSAASSASGVAAWPVEVNHPGLTQTGVLMGTPAYMSPEQFCTTRVDTRSDQFSFCVALYEALYGYRPFSGENVAALRTAVLLADPLPPPRGTAVPGWVHQAFLRGLQRDPTRRYINMSELLTALSTDPSARRRRSLGIAGVVLTSGLAAAAVGVAMYEWRATSMAVCVGGEARLVGVWDPAVAETTRAALVSTGVNVAEDVAMRVVTRLDAYAEDWVRMHREACETHRRDEQSDALFDLRMACLDERRTAVGALVGVLMKADVEVVTRAVQAAEDLPSLDRCADARALLAQSPPPEDPETARAVEALNVRLAMAWAKLAVGQVKAVAAETAEMRVEAETLGHAPLLASILQLEGSAADDLGDYKTAEKTLLRAVAVADRAADDERRGRAQLDLVRVVGLHQARFEEGLRYAELTAGTLGRLSDAGDLEAALAGRLAEVTLQQGELDRAERYIVRSLELQRRVHGDASPEFAVAVTTRGTLHFFRGELPVALADYRQAVRIYEELYGAHHPSLGAILNNVGAVELTQFDNDAAAATFTRARQILENTYGETHPSLGSMHVNLGLIALFQGRREQAVEEFRRALAIDEKHLPAEHPLMASCLDELGEALTYAGDLKGALETYERAVKVHLAVYGAGHAKVSVALANLGGVQLRSGDLAAAEQTFKRSLAEFRGAGDAPELGWTYAGLGALRFAQARVDEAVAALETALSRMQSNPNMAPYRIAEVQFALARALWQQSPENEARVRSLAADAQQNYSRVGRGFQSEVATVRAWLAGIPVTAG